jgi:hypothetical protein
VEATVTNKGKGSKRQNVQAASETGEGHPLMHYVGMSVRETIAELVPPDAVWGITVSKGEAKDGSPKPQNVGVTFAGPNKANSAQWGYTVVWGSSGSVRPSDVRKAANMALAKAEAKAEAREAAEAKAAAKAAEAKARKEASLARLRKAAGIG